MLNSTEILELIEKQQLVREYVDLRKQLQPCGFDLSLAEIRRFDGGGCVDFSNEKRVIGPTLPVQPDPEGWYDLSKGCYLMVYNEVVKMPLDVVAIARTRSTLLRNGVSVETAVWDPGYQGRSSSLLVVHSPHGVRIRKNARVAQLVFSRIKEVKEGYGGIYQDERVKKQLKPDHKRL